MKYVKKIMKLPMRLAKSLFAAFNQKFPVFRLMGPLKFLRYKLLAIKNDTISPFRRSESGFITRQYDSEEDYIEHQKSKLHFMEERLENSRDRRILRFYNNFEKFLGSEKGKSILCLGARDGAEVEALRRYGLLALGIDIAYPENSPYVHYGDFHNNPYPDDCFDYAYTNCLDHILKPMSVISEIARILKPKTGIFCIDLVGGVKEVGNDALKGDFESFVWERREDVIKLFEEQNFSIEKKQVLDNNYVQILFKVGK